MAYDSTCGLGGELFPEGKALGRRYVKVTLINMEK